MADVTRPLPLTPDAWPRQAIARLAAWRRSRAWRLFAKNHLAVIGLVTLLALVFVAIFAPFLRTVDFTDIATWGQPYEFPSPEHWLGTDSNGRDLWSRMIYGTRVALELGFAAVALNFLIGVPLGTLAAVGGRLADFAVNRLIEIMSSFPTILFALILASLLIAAKPAAVGPIAASILGAAPGGIVGYIVAHVGQRSNDDAWRLLFRRLVEWGCLALGAVLGWVLLSNAVLDLANVPGGTFTIVILIIGLTSWIRPARLMRGQILAIRQKDYVLAAYSIGATEWHVARYYLIPNALGPLLVSATFAVPAAIGTEAGLSFFGLGVAPPTPTWGQLLNEGAPYLRFYWFYTAFPALALTVTMLAFSFLADGLHNVLGAVD